MGNRAVTVVAEGKLLAGVYGPPRGVLQTPGALVIFAHGSGSSHASPRNQWVASHLNIAGVATLLFDLLTEREAADRRLVFDIDLLASRLQAATTWAKSQADMVSGRIGYFGASTGAGAALTAAARQPGLIHAIVSRGGRPDLCTEPLDQIQVPTLLLVGGADPQVLELNRDAARQLPDCRLQVIHSATHLFEEPGTLEQVAEHARHWFEQHLLPPAAPH